MEYKGVAKSSAYPVHRGNTRRSPTLKEVQYKGVVKGSANPVHRGNTRRKINALKSFSSIEEICATSKPYAELMQFIKCGLLIYRFDLSL